MDQLSRSDEFKEQLDRADWDLVVVDEAHRMSAHYFGSELKKTKRYQLGELLGRHARHFLLMTATPHAGREEDFQLFMALLDTDRFEGRYRDAVHTVNTDGLMRRMVKEDLKTFEGRPLFPERRAYTVAYELSDGGEGPLRRGHPVRPRGDEPRRPAQASKATTSAASPSASPSPSCSGAWPPARKRSSSRSNDATSAWRSGATRCATASVRGRTTTWPGGCREMLGRDLTDAGDDELDDVPSSEAEEIESEVADAATAARTIAELDKELAILADLIEVARRVRHSGTDKKWTELRDLLTDNTMVTGEKIIIFTEHRDTLEYLAERIRGLLGRPDAVVTIHGGVRREERRKITELFTQDVDTRVLVATDAAGEGLNLQRAHLMVNYDLPWNPNRIEQRFGRIHRIGQTEVCHLWNLVAADTREGMVFTQLLGKIEEQRKAYHGKVFDVLGEAFEGQPLRDLLVQAIRYGNDPKVRARLHQVIDETVGEGLDKLIAERAAHADMFAVADLEKWRARMDEANAPAACSRTTSARSSSTRSRYSAAACPSASRPLRDPARPRRHPRPGPPDRPRAAPVLRSTSG